MSLVDDNEPEMVFRKPLPAILAAQCLNRCDDNWRLQAGDALRRFNFGLDSVTS
jgi:hypothetical protein